MLAFVSAMVRSDDNIPYPTSSMMSVVASTGSIVVCDVDEDGHDDPNPMAKSSHRLSMFTSTSVPSILTSFDIQLLQHQVDF
jgi:hypothetical protein